MKWILLVLVLLSLNASAQKSDQDKLPKCIKSMIKQKDSLKAAGVTQIVSFTRKGQTLYYFENGDSKIVTRPPHPYTMIYYNGLCGIEATLQKTAAGKIIVSKGFVASDFVNRQNRKVLWSAPVRID